MAFDRLIVLENLWHLHCDSHGKKFNEEKLLCKWKKPLNCGTSGKLVVVCRVSIQTTSKNISSALELAITSAQRAGHMSIHLKKAGEILNSTSHGIVCSKLWRATGRTVKPNNLSYFVLVDHADDLFTQSKIWLSVMRRGSSKTLRIQLPFTRSISSAILEPAK